MQPKRNMLSFAGFFRPPLKDLRCSNVDSVHQIEKLYPARNNGKMGDAENSKMATLENESSEGKEDSNNSQVSGAKTLNVVDQHSNEVGSVVLHRVDDGDNICHQPVLNSQDKQSKGNVNTERLRDVDNVITMENLNLSRPSRSFMDILCCRQAN